jgi:hypothetical protein
MKASEARVIVAGGMLTYAELRKALVTGESDHVSTSCSLFSKGEVRELIRAAINGKRGFIEPGSIWALYAVWGLVEFS